MKIPRGMKQDPASSRGFTRVDLIIVFLLVCVGTALANIWFVPPVSLARMRADALVCQDNLGQVGRAFQMWAADHEDRFPFLVPSNAGGLRGHSLSPNAFLQFAWASNGMPNAKILVCPADTNTVRRAKDFSTNPDGGFMHPNYRGNALSYLISFHAQSHLPRSILSSDRNVDGTQPSTCSIATFSVALVSAQPGTPTPAQFAQETIHFGKGNVLFTDGSVELGGAELWRSSLSSADDGNGRIHVQFPR